VMLLGKKVRLDGAALLRDGHIRIKSRQCYPGTLG
jgi:hypothetical protein